jgi:hypothetical protein
MPFTAWHVRACQLQSLGRQGGAAARASHAGDLHSKAALQGSEPASLSSVVKEGLHPFGLLVFRSAWLRTLTSSTQ